MKTKYFLWMVLGILCWWGCGDDSESLEPSGIDEWHPVLVDGGHDYDAKIKDWNERTGVYILYKFTPRDIYYNGDGNWREVFQDTTWERETYTIGENVYVDGDYVVVDGDRYPLGITADGDYAWQQVSLSEDETIVEIMNYEVKAKRRRVETEEWSAEEEENVSVHTYVNYILRALGYDEITDEIKKKIEQFVEGWVERISSAFVRNGKEYYPYDVLLIYHIV